MRKTWSVELDGDQHTVEYKRAWWSHRGSIEVDGVPAVPTAEPWVRMGVDHPFALAGHSGIVHIRMGAASLSVDGREPATGQAITVARPISSAFFAAAIALIVLPISLGASRGWGLAVLPAGAIAGAGGGLMLAIGGRASWSSRRRVGIGLATAIATVVVSVAVAIGINSLTPIPSERPFGQWVGVEVPGGGFSLIFPSTPSESATSLSGGSLTLQVHAFVSEDSRAAFGAAFSDYPDEPVDTGAALEGVARNAATSNGGTLTEDRSVTANGLDGREFTISVPRSGSSTGQEIHARVFLSHQRIYLISAILKGSGGAAAANVIPFLESFALDPP